MIFDKVPYFIAEISANHLGKLSIARRLVEAAAEAKADAIKLQTYTPQSMTLDIDAPHFRVSPGHPLWGGRSLFDLYTQAQTPRDWHQELFELANDLGLDAFSTPFDESAVDFLESLNVPAYKVASLEIVDLPLIERIGQTGKPILISTGAASLQEISEAVSVAKQAGSAKVIPLVCTSSYPAQPSDAHLRRIPVLQEIFGSAVGLSDHTLGAGVSTAGIALGATVVEKHLTLDRALGGADAEFSMEPQEFRQLVQYGKEAHEALGSPSHFQSQSEAESIRLRPSLYIVFDVEEGGLVSSENVASLRPSGGLPPKAFLEAKGRKFKGSFPAGTPLTWDLLT